MFAKLSHVCSCRYHCLNVDAISWVSNRHQMFRPLSSMHPRGGGADCWPITTSSTKSCLPIWFAESKPEPNWCSLCSFPRARASVFHSLPLYPQHCQLRWKTCSKSLLGIPLFSSRFPFMSRPGLGTWLSSIHGTLLFSAPRVQWTLPVSLTMDTRTIYIYLVGGLNVLLP